MMTPQLARWNALPLGDAEAEVFACCGSQRWASEMAARRPFADFVALCEAADKIWCCLLYTSCRTTGDDSAHANFDWTEILPRAPLEADARRVFEKELRAPGEATHVRLNIYPDGGVARLRVFGQRAKHLR